MKNLAGIGRPFTSHESGPEMNGALPAPGIPRTPIYPLTGLYPPPFTPPHAPARPPAFADPQSPTLLSQALTTLSLRAPLCPRCRGRKYNFTRYFHKSALFKTPPHHILFLVEKAYILKNHLQSLLVTYILHHFELEYLDDVKKQAKQWGENVDALVDEVVNSAEGFQVELGPLGDVKAFVKSSVMKMWDHITGTRQMPMSLERWTATVLEFRKLWERVWLGYLQDQESQKNQRWSQGDAPSFHVVETEFAI